METIADIALAAKPIKDVAVEMLTENTGRALCDSGDYYGRSWERNQGHDFEKDPKVSVRFEVSNVDPDAGGKLYLSTTVSLYHWMVGNLEYDPEMQEKFLKVAERNPRVNWLCLMEEFADEVAKDNGNSTGQSAVYTYNHPDSCDLSQDVQYVKLFTDSDYEPTHLILQVHGGCDARSGLTAPNCFKLTGEDREYLDSMTIDGIAAGDQVWDRDGLGNFEPIDTNDCKLTLKELPAYNLDELEGVFPELNGQVEELGQVIEEAEKTKQRLETTKLTPQQVETARQVIDASVQRFSEELRNTCVVALAKRHEWFVISSGAKAWLFSDDATEFADGDQLCGFSNLL